MSALAPAIQEPECSISVAFRTRHFLFIFNKIELQRMAPFNAVEDQNSAQPRKDCDANRSGESACETAVAGGGRGSARSALIYRPPEFKEMS